MKAFLCLASWVLATRLAAAEGLPASDRRADTIRDLNTPRAFPVGISRGAWQARSKAIRENTLVGCGLWPMPEKTPLHARVSPPVVHDGVAVHRVFLETYPGFYLGGTLYVPTAVNPTNTDKAVKRIPAVLNPHGHGKFGRLHDDDAYSNPARCLQFARMGMVAFSYDMVGYQDTLQFGAHRQFFLQPELQLWNFSLMGMQTWNSIRALDFLLELPFVDPKRIACTGESGGGTQTFMLGAVEDRLLAQAPICMVSHSMQGGCQCENAPGLRVGFSNMDIAAAAAPRRQLLVAATGDWTKATMEVEGPALAHAYSLAGAREKLHFEIHPFPHNYNQTTREVVYGWFNRWLLGAETAERVAELPHTKLPEETVRVFPGARQPLDALKEPEFLAARIKDAALQLFNLRPRDRKSLEEYRRVQSVAWQHNLQLDPKPEVVVERGESADVGGVRRAALAIGRPGEGDRLPALLFTPLSGKKSALVVVVHPSGKGALVDANGQPAGLARALVERGHPVLLADLFLTGENARPEAAAKRKYFEKFFTTYNRTDMQERVQDLITLSAAAKQELGARKVVLAGVGRAGPWTLLAAPGADGVAADLAGVSGADEKELFAQDLFVPGLRKTGAFAGAASVAAPNPLLVHNGSLLYADQLLIAAYEATRAKEKFRREAVALDDAAVATWIAGQFGR